MSPAIDAGSVTSLKDLTTLSPESEAALQAEAEADLQVDSEFENVDLLWSQFIDFDYQAIDRFARKSFDYPLTPVTRRYDAPAHTIVLDGTLDGEPHTEKIFVTPNGRDKAGVDAIIKHAEDWLNGPRHRYMPVHSAAFVQAPPMQWLVQGIIPDAELVVIYGESTSGKSFIAYDLAAAISSGNAWRGKRAVQGPVVYIAAEGSAGMTARVNAYSRARNVGHQVLPWILPQAPNMTDPADVADLAKGLLLAQPSYSVIVLDTLSRVLNADENSAQDMGLFAKNCKYLTQKTGAVVIAVHHSGKSKSLGARGSNSLRAAADAEIEVTREGDRRYWNIAKLKDAEDGERGEFRLQRVVLGLDQYGEEFSSCVVEHVQGVKATPTRALPTGKWQRAVYVALKAAGTKGLTCDALQAAVFAAEPHDGDGRDKRKQRVKEAIRELTEDEFATQAGDLITLIPVDDGFDE